MIKSSCVPDYEKMDRLHYGTEIFKLTVVVG